MLLDMCVAAALLAIGNVKFRHFVPYTPWWRRLLKALLAVAAVGVVSHYFGHAGSAIALGIALLPLMYIHGIWLPRHGVNGWTAEPRDRYHELMGWPPPKR